jgi:class 3 adenylate cyclase/HAMP domain-containing protein
MDSPSKNSSIGVRGRLLMAFVGICMFSLFAAAAGFYSLSQVGGALTQITENRVPEALSWLQLSRRVEGIVRSAPALLVAKTEQQRTQVSAEITSQAKRLKPLLQRGGNYETEEEKVAAELVASLVGNLNNNLADLDVLVKRRLSIVAHRDKLVRKLARASSVAQRTLAPGSRILASQIAGWHRGIASSGSAFQKSTEQYELAGSIIKLLQQQKAAVLVDGFHNNLLKIATAETSEGVDILLFPLRKIQKELFGLVSKFPKRIRKRMVLQIAVFGGLTVGPESLPEVRKSELKIIAEAEELLAANVRQSTFLTTKINFLVERANAEIAKANIRASQIQALNRQVLIAIVVLSLLSSLLIVWLYVGRNLIARLTALSDSMLAIAGGNLRAPLPKPGGNDEITRMAQALTVFRDTAIEVEENNLRDIEQARRRLVDAIENSSEGFAFYDPEDHLVISNDRYRELLYPGVDIDIKPGIAFEAMIRTAAKNGHIAEAEGRVEEWVAERLAVHRDPGEPRVQHRSGDQWILVTERKTGDGGTVAIYSDITDLKQSEQDLTTKSNALEQLSNQLAKYLSPQIYDSIFSGKQEVKLVSQRKRLTVFFSDLVGFTETTERLESEDLTRLLNQYLTEMSQIALAHGATIDKYIGDAIVIFFGDPETLGVKEDAFACVTMAIAMRKRMKELETVWRDAGVEKPLQCRMGINTGVCTVGNFGSEDRMDYTIIGGGVNLAARLETACEPNEILISYETLAHVNDLIHCEERDKIRVKGIAHPVATYQVVDLRESLDGGKLPVRTKLPHFQLDVDVSLMSSDEQREALAVLRDLVDRLSNIDTEAKPLDKEQIVDAAQ